MALQARRILLFSTAGLLAIALAGVVAALIGIGTILRELAAGPNPVCDRLSRTDLTLNGNERLRSPTMVHAKNPQRAVVRSASLGSIEVEILGSHSGLRCGAIENGAARQCEWIPASPFAVAITNRSSEPARVRFEALVDRCDAEETVAKPWAKD